MANKRECDRCKRQTDVKELDDEVFGGRGGYNAWGKVNANTVGDEYGFKLNADLCGSCWKLLREDFMGGNGIPVIKR